MTAWKDRHFFKSHNLKQNTTGDLKMIYKIPIEKIDEIGKRNGYVRFDHQENIGMASYSDGSTRINIYLTKMTVSTCLNHPKKGATQLFRRNVDVKLLEEIFAYPRKHTGKGYYKKK